MVCPELREEQHSTRSRGHFGMDRYEASGDTETAIQSKSLLQFKIWQSGRATATLRYIPERTGNGTLQEPWVDAAGVESMTAWQRAEIHIFQKVLCTD